MCIRDRVGEVAQAPVDELAGPGARAGRQVPLVHQSCPQAGLRGAPGDPRPRDAAADDEDVERACRETGPRAIAPAAVHPGGHRAVSYTHLRAHETVLE